jgi:hypothetical protein
LDWFSEHLWDVGIRNLLQSEYDGILTRDIMLDVFQEVEADGTVSQSEFTTLQQLVTLGPKLNMSPSVSDLTNKVVNGDYANRFSGDGIFFFGDLYAGASAASLSTLVNDWFKGGWQLAYVGSGLKTTSGPLFGSSGSPSYTDADQGLLDDTSLISALAEVAKQDPSAIKSMFQPNDDGTYTVRFYGPNDQFTYVTVNTSLPDGGNLFGQAQGDLWVALAEKAVVELNQSGWLQTEDPGSNSYWAIGNSTAGSIDGTTQAYLTAITGAPASTTHVYSDNAWNRLFGNVTDPRIFARELAAGSCITFRSTFDGSPGLVIGDEEYALVSYNPDPFGDRDEDTYTLFCPAGINNGGYPATVTLNIDQLDDFFESETCTATQYSITVPNDVNVATAAVASSAAGAAQPAESTTNTSPVGVANYTAGSTQASERTASVNAVALDYHSPSSTQDSASTTSSKTATPLALPNSQRTAHDLAFSTWDNELELLAV